MNGKKGMLVACLLVIATGTSHSFDLGRAVRDVGRTIEKAAQDTGKTVEKAAQDTGKTVEKAAQDSGATIEKAAHDTGQTVEKAAQDTGTAIEKAAQDTGKTIEKAAQDTGKTIEKAAQDTGAEIRRAGRNLEEAAHAIGRFTERQAHGLGDSLSTAERRVREGKVVDAMWHLGTDQFRYTEQNAAKAAQESSLVNTVGQVAATAYGGPGGAAAYAAWYTFRETGDADLALRVALITGATSAAMGQVGGLPSATGEELTKKVVVAGAVGGLAVAAAGGDEAAIKEGFLRAGGMVLVQDGYKRVTQYDLDARSSQGEAYCMSTVGAECSPPDSAYVRDEQGNIRFDSDGKPLVDVTKTDPRRPHVGNWSTESEANWNHERGAFMTSVSRIPGMNAMAVFHDQWAVSWDMSAFQSQATIAPAVVLTYIGTGASVYDLIQKTSVQDAKQAEGAAIALKSMSPAEVSADGRQPPNNPTVQYATFLCANGTVSRTIIVEETSPDPPPLCRTIYFRESGESIPWTARHDGEFCVKNAADLAGKLEASGWSCFVQ